MLRRKKTSARPIAEINVVPYIDVMLVLLVIFMITAPMLTQGVTVDLPKAASETLKSTDREPIIVSVNQQGDYFLNIHSDPASPIAPQALKVRVAAELELARQSKQVLNVLVKGDQGVPYGKVVMAMSLLKQAGAEQVGLITDSSEMGQENRG
ncbi:MULTISPECIES: protein TolR [Legionella]|uniref:Tol-Pal system protein TolR n=1 Tax=Legionella maceachernii TaxID=466 RepID=A0A0W0VU63_9GAMM|nr:protein TolR [Legionella maceachernii]KTD23509.1 membrane spanning protein in TolA-TolQ-TolR complex [Legionella maceachernii]SJZ70086.1 biopolymer transport protein TolR [Legionella maceachernii]SUP02253.1 colicin uptake protein TolR [Legionella maceachernii]